MILVDLTNFKRFCMSDPLCFILRFYHSYQSDVAQFAARDEEFHFLPLDGR